MNNTSYFIFYHFDLHLNLWNIQVSLLLMLYYLCYSTYKHSSLNRHSNFSIFKLVRQKNISSHVTEKAERAKSFVLETFLWWKT